MKNKNKIIFGAVVIFIGFVQLAIIGLLTRSRPQLRTISPVSAGIFGACLCIGIGQIARGRNPQFDEEMEIEEKDERNQFIQGKASYIAFCATVIMVMFFGSYVTHILNNEIAGFICYGIGVAGLAIYYIAYRVFGRKL